jgi:hypothetical protein
MLFDNDITAIRRNLTRNLDPGSFVINTETGEVSLTDTKKAFIQNMAKAPPTSGSVPNLSM